MNQNGNLIYKVEKKTKLIHFKKLINYLLFFYKESHISTVNKFFFSQVEYF